MSYYSTLLAAAQQAQVVLAGMCDPSADGVFVLASPAGSYTGVFNEQNELDPMDPTGIRRTRELFIYATRDQFATSPKGAPRTTLTAKGITWTVQNVTEEPLHYRFVCRIA